MGPNRVTPANLPATGGFSGSPADTAHLPSTYTALAALALLRAPLDQLNRPGLASFLRACQAEDGSFAPTAELQGEFQNDTRMSYCAAIARAMLRGGESGDGGAAESSSTAANGTRGAAALPDINVAAALSFLGRCKVRIH